MNAEETKNNEQKSPEKSLLRHLDDRMLVNSSTKLGLTDYDPEEKYDHEEKKFGIKEIGIVIAAVAGFIAIAALICALALG